MITKICTLFRFKALKEKFQILKQDRKYHRKTIEGFFGKLGMKEVRKN